MLIKSINKNERSIQLENKGSIAIDGFILRVVSGGSGSEKIIQKVELLKTATLTYSFSLASDARVDLIPSLIPEGINAPLVPCSNKHKVVKIE